MLQLALLGALTARAAGDCACTDFAMPAMSSRGVHGGYLGETDQEILGRSCDDYISQEGSSGGWASLVGLSACGWIEANGPLGGGPSNGYGGCDG